MANTSGKGREHVGRRILVSSNCQTGGLHAALTAMLPRDSLDELPWSGTQTQEVLDLVGDADVWVTSVPRETAQSILGKAGSTARIIAVPEVWFTGFHPDQTPILRHNGAELHGAVGPYHSKIVIWSWLHGLTPAQTMEHFTPRVFAGLGYLEAWQPAVDILRMIFEPTDLSMRDWLLPLSRNGVFMLTNNHPRVEAVIQTARLVAAQLGAEETRLRYPWELVIPDGLLATSYVWPVYPGIADSLDLPGAYVWRLGSGEFIDLAEFIDRSFESYRDLDPDTIGTVHIDLDPRFAGTLAPAGLTRAGSQS